MNGNNLYFSYQGDAPIIKGMNLTLNSGHIYGLLGQNGAGKTTLLKLIAGLCFPNAGNLEVLGYLPKNRDPRFLQELFFIPEHFNLPLLSIAEYAKYYGKFYPRFDQQLFDAITQEFALNPKLLLPHLSHGQKKLLLTAFALSTRAQLLIMDEPSNGLDILNKEIWQRLLVQEIGGEQLVIISTHQIHDIAQIIDSVLIMHTGQMLLNASIAELETKLSCGLQTEAPKTDSVFYFEQEARGYAYIKANTEEAAASIDLKLLFQAVLKNTQITKLFTGAAHDAS